MYRGEGRGWVELVTGSMFSSKTEELIRRVTRAKIARQQVQVVKHALDTRFTDSNLALLGLAKLA